MKIIERIYNAETGETLDIERDANAQEIKENQEAKIRIETILKLEAEAQIKRQNALSKLEALGLDEDDLKALGL